MLVAGIQQNCTRLVIWSTISVAVVEIVAICAPRPLLFSSHIDSRRHPMTLTDPPSAVITPKLPVVDHEGCAQYICALVQAHAEIWTYQLSH